MLLDDIINLLKVVAKPRKLTTTSFSNHYGKTKMIDVSTSLKQENRERQGLATTHNKVSLNTDLYSDGYFSGYIGLEATHPEDYSYWSGYQIGCREYWAKKLGVEISQQF